MAGHLEIHPEVDQRGGSGERADWWQRTCHMVKSLIKGDNVEMHWGKDTYMARENDLWV